ncbi:MAG: nuclear transport factor 2 family protein [Caulobacteraceae bacterium]|nr:nuclear transport factor 2 family protein [Caulobacteraceae bacterium]
MTGDEIRALAEGFFNAIEAGDIEAVRASYAPDAKIWHNTDELATSVAENIETLTGFTQRIRERRYRDRRLAVFEGGFVQQHVLHGVRADGVAVSLPACLVCLVEDGRITRLDEYFDSARVAIFRAVAHA